MNSPVVLVIGAGPAGLYAAQALVKGGTAVVLINQDEKPGGLAEYGIHYSKDKMKNGLRRQFDKILSDPLVSYYGGLRVGEQGDISLPDLLKLGADAVLVTVGAQGTKWLGLEGEQLSGVYHAKDLVYHYNGRPPFDKEQFSIGQHVAIIGAGNVMVDVANWLFDKKPVEDVTVLYRRDPTQVKFTAKEITEVNPYLNRQAFEQELSRIHPTIEQAAIDLSDIDKQFFKGVEPDYVPPASPRFHFRFLSSPERFVGNAEGEVIGVEYRHMTLERREDGALKLLKLDKTDVLPVDTAILAVGDSVDLEFGLPVGWAGFEVSEEPQFPIDGISYEARGSNGTGPLPGVFVAGWAREASTGLVGVARKDGTNAATAVLAYLEEKTASGDLSAIKDRIEGLKIAA